MHLRGCRGKNLIKGFKFITNIDKDGGVLHSKNITYRKYSGYPDKKYFFINRNKYYSMRIYINKKAKCDSFHFIVKESNYLIFG